MHLQIFKSELQRLKHEDATMKERIKDNADKIKLNKQLPWLVANIVELLDVEPDTEEDGAAADLDAQRQGKCAVVKTSTRQVKLIMFLFLQSKNYIFDVSILLNNLLYLMCRQSSCRSSAWSIRRN